MSFKKAISNSISVLLVLVVLITNSLFLCTSAYAEEETTSSLYVGGIQYLLTTGNVPLDDFTFDSNIHEYSLVSESVFDALRLIAADETPVNTFSRILVEDEKTGTKISETFLAHRTSWSTQLTQEKQLKDLGITPEMSVKITWDIGVITGYWATSISDFSDYSTYVLHVSCCPSITWLNVFDNNGKALTLTPTSNNNSGIVPFIREYTTATTTSVIRITAHGGNISQAGYNNYPEVWLNSQYTGNPIKVLNEYEVDVSVYLVEDDTVARIPLQAKYGEAVTEYVLYVGLAGVPTVTLTPNSITAAKGEAVSLTANVSFAQEDAAGSISYQWMRNGAEIEGANNATYTVPTDRAWTQKYSCRVTNTLNGKAYTVTSNEVVVTTELSFLNPPVIRLDLSGTDGVDSADFRTDYTAGEKLNALFVQLDYPEDGALHEFQLYYNTERSISGAIPFGAKVTTTKSGRINTYDSYQNWRINPDGLSAGDYYIFAQISAIPRYDDDLKPASTYSRYIQVHISEPDLPFSGKGTAEEPYLLNDTADMEALRDIVNAGDRVGGLHFRMTADIALPSDWTPIGYKANDSSLAEPFSGILDGDGHTLTVATGGKPLFSRVSDAEIKNLDIYGEMIDGCGLIDQSFLDYGPDGNYNTGVPESVKLDHIRLLSGSSTRRAGLMEGSGSGANTITILNCVVEEGVTVGYTKDQSGIGSFVGGSFNGRMYNCYSYADVYGASSIGGLAGHKGQAMGACDFYNCAFLGTVTATGTSVGGLIGEGYVSESAPNTQVVSFDNCYVAADITGADKVGGLIGAESGIVYAINNHRLTNSFFYGTLTATNSGAAYVGGIVGYYNGLNAIGSKGNNYYYEKSGSATGGFGGYGGYNLSTAEGGDKYDFADAAAFDAFLSDFGKVKTQEEFANGTVLKAMKDGGADSNAWQQGALYPEFTGASTITKVELVGTLPESCYIGDELDLSGITLIATYSDGKVESGIVVKDNDKVTVSGFDSSVQGECTVVVAFGSASASFKVTILKKDAEGITVYFTLLGDDLHNSNEDGNVHTLAAGNLQTWITRTAYTLDGNATVLDLIREALGQNNITVTVKEKTALGTAYIPSITRNGVTIGEFDNGPNSGWMYTINGKGSNNGVAQQFLSDGDEIVFHYSDDYTKEDYSMGWTGTIDNQSGSAAKVTVADAKTGTVTVDCALACAVIGQKADGSYVLLPASVSGNTVSFDASAYTKVIVRIKGDITGDGKVDSSDTLLMKQLVAGIKEPEAITALLLDLTGDGKINSSDTLKMKRVAAGLDSLAW